MKKLTIIAIAFVLFFAALGYFIWWQHRSNQTTVQPPQNTSQPLSSAPADTSWRYPDFNFARLSGDSLHLYSLPIKSDSTIEAAVHKDEIDNDCIKVIAKKGEWYQNEDSLWIIKTEILPYFPINSVYYKIYDTSGFVRPDKVIDLFPNNVYAPLSTVKYYCINDSLLNTPPKIIKTNFPIKVIGRRIEGYQIGCYYYETLKVIVYKDSTDSMIGWSKAADLVMVDANKVINSNNNDIIYGPVGFTRGDGDDVYHTFDNAWLKTPSGFLNLGHIRASWNSPDSRYNFTVGDSTWIRDSLGNTVFCSPKIFTSPCWYNNIVYPRTIDAIYKINLTKGTVNSFHYCTEGAPNYDEGDYYYFSLPEPIADTMSKTITVKFARFVDHTNLKTRVTKTEAITYAVKLNFSGKVLSIDSTNN